MASLFMALCDRFYRWCNTDWCECQTDPQREPEEKENQIITCFKQTNKQTNFIKIFFYKNFIK
jgi:hypothetical protein